MAILAEDETEVDALLQPPRIIVILPPEHIYEEEVEQNIQLHNAQIKVVWRNKCAKVIAQGN